MEIQHDDNGKKGSFYMEQDGERVAEMTHTWAGESMFIIDHTEVSEKLKGQGAGKKLVEASVAFARKLNVKILPLCPFAKNVFDKSPEYDDLWR